MPWKCSCPWSQSPWLPTTGRWSMSTTGLMWPERGPSCVSTPETGVQGHMPHQVQDTWPRRSCLPGASLWREGQLSTCKVWMSVFYHKVRRHRQAYTSQIWWTTLLVLCALPVVLTNEMAGFNVTPNKILSGSAIGSISKQYNFKCSDITL